MQTYKSSIYFPPSNTKWVKRKIKSYIQFNIEQKNIYASLIIFPNSYRQPQVLGPGFGLDIVYRKRERDWGVSDLFAALIFATQMSIDGLDEARTRKTNRCCTSNKPV